MINVQHWKLYAIQSNDNDESLGILFGVKAIAISIQTLLRNGCTYNMGNSQ